MLKSVDKEKKSSEKIFCGYYIFQVKGKEILDIFEPSVEKSSNDLVQMNYVRIFIKTELLISTESY